MSELYHTGLEHERRITRLEDRMDQNEEATTWNRRILILVVLYGGGGSAIMGADRTSDFLAGLIKIALKIP